VRTNTQRQQSRTGMSRDWLSLFEIFVVMICTPLMENQ
jgi:hypothetical protein